MKPKSKIASFFYALFVDLRHLNFIKKIEEVVRRMKYSEKILFYAVSFIVVVSGLVLLFRLNDSLLVEVPAFGGSLTEGLIGSPRFINPVLAISDTDRDLSSLLYSGLLKQSENGSFEPNLAESYNVSSDSTVYDFKIKDNASFHDGKKMTADDVIFTIEKVLDPIIKSPKKANWEGVLVEKVSDKEIKFTLGKPYSPFLSALTLGILPKHIWENVSSEEFPFSQFNIDPVGSGFYKVEKISRNSGGIPTTIILSSWGKYVSGRPKIKSITFKFFQNETDLMKAYDDKSIENAAGLSPVSAKKINVDGNLVSYTSLPRVFGVFLNQNVAPVFLNKEIRDALDQATPKKRIVDEVLYGFGRVLNGPTPSYTEEDAQRAAGDIEAAKASLLKAGWKENANGILEKKIKKDTVLFSFSITTSDAPELKQTAEILKEAWEKIGASVSIKVFEAGDLSQNVIRGRKYDALLFGEVVGDDSDLFPFWHSSERNDPGLNISLYANITVDKALEDIQKETNNQIKTQKKEIVASEIKKDIPAIFLFSPNLLYATTPKIKNVTLKSVSSLNERFLYVNNWYIETDKVWKIFVKN
jgi:peptide/nickel transport system substrate-binding protein